MNPVSGLPDIIIAAHGKTTCEATDSASNPRNRTETAMSSVDLRRFGAVRNWTDCSCSVIFSTSER